MQAEIFEDEEVPEESKRAGFNILRVDSGNRYCMQPAFMLVLVNHMRKGGRACR